MSTPTLRWGHININVTNLDRSIAFYQKLGFEVFIPAIPYLGMSLNAESAIPKDAADVLQLPPATRGRACIMQLGSGFPKLDLTELKGTKPTKPLTNGDLGLVRFCLGSEDLAADHAKLQEAGVSFASKPGPTNGGLADVAICVDPDGTLIELIQPHLEKWR